MRRLVLQTMAQSRLKTAPESWIGPLRRALASRDDDAGRRRGPHGALVGLPPDAAGELGDAAHRNRARRQRDPDLRLDALAAVPGGLAEVDAEMLGPASSPAATRRARRPPNRRRRHSGQGDARRARSSSSWPRTSARPGRSKSKNCWPRSPSRRTSESEQDSSRLCRSRRRSCAARRDAQAGAGKIRAATRKSRPTALYATLAADSEKDRAGLEALLAQLTDGDVRAGR